MTSHPVSSVHSSSVSRCDVVVVGGGIVGLATAWQLQNRHPDKRVIVLEKEASVAFHQTGRNSGVIHSGIYYKPGSLKATNCRIGKRLLETFCAEHGVAYEICGKVIVATSDEERPRLAKILERGTQNGVRCEMITAARLREIEPHVAGVAAIHVPETGIVDYRGVCEKLTTLIKQRGGDVILRAQVTDIRTSAGEVTVQSTAGDFRSQKLVGCAGLQSDRIARAAGEKPSAKIVPFRGEYFELTPASEHLVKGLIYPVPDPSFPFLGVHFTRMIQGGVECGPNAVLAFAREGYRMLDINLADLAETLTYGGFLRLATKHWRMGAGEFWRSLSKRAFVRALSRLVPEIREQHLHVAPAGVRAQAVAPDGMIVDDFVIQRSGRMVHVLNAPSPAATAALQIGQQVVDELEKTD